MSVFRFAPSPNGELHLGHAYSALLNARLAKQAGGNLLLRMEDIDTARCTPEFETAIYRDLEWLGLAWEMPVRRQSEHFHDYAIALEKLKARGLVYPAFMSRGEVRGWIAEHEAMGKVWPRDPDGAPHYPPVDKRLSVSERGSRMASGEPFAWRLDMEMALGGQTLSWTELDPPSGTIERVTARPEQWGDVILARSDTPTSYHLSVVVDDALQGVTHVVRGRDLYEATAVHRLLQDLLGLPEPAYHHHRLIRDADGRKLSKSEKSTGLRQLREAGVTPNKIREMLGFASQHHGS